MSPERGTFVRDSWKPPASRVFSTGFSTPILDNTYEACNVLLIGLRVVRLFVIFKLVKMSLFVISIPKLPLTSSPPSFKQHSAQNHQLKTKPNLSRTQLSEIIRISIGCSSLRRHVLSVRIQLQQCFQFDKHLSPSIRTELLQAYFMIVLHPPVTIELLRTQLQTGVLSSKCFKIDGS